MTTVSPRPGTPFPHVADISHGSPVASRSYFDLTASASSSTRSSSSSSSIRRYSQPLHFTLQPVPTRTPPSLLKRSASSAGSGSTSTSTSTPEREIKHRRSLSPIPSPALESEPTTPPPTIERRESSSSSATLSPPMPSTPQHSAVQRPIIAHGMSDFPELVEFRLGASAAAAQETNVGVIELLEDEAYDLARSQAEAFYRKPITPPSTPAFGSSKGSKYPYQYPTKALPSSPLVQPQIKRPALSHRPVLKRRDTPRPVETFTSIALSSLGSWYGSSPFGMHEMIEEVDERRPSAAAARRYRSMIDGGEWTVLA